MARVDFDGFGVGVYSGCEGLSQQKGKRLLKLSDF